MSQVGRNDPCPCGSGKKYKKCCTPRFDAPSPAALAPRGGPTTWLSSGQKHAESFAEAARWPLAEVWGPDPVVWAVTGVGSAGVIRRKDDLAAFAAFPLTLTDGGVPMVFGKAPASPAELSSMLQGLFDQVGPPVLADPTQTAALVRACLAHGTRTRGPYPPDARGFVSLLPPSAAPSLLELAGKGMHPRALLEIARGYSRLPDVEDGAEIMLLTTAAFRTDDPTAVVAALTAAGPDFDLRTDLAVPNFEFTRPSKPGQRAPHSRIEGRRVQGSVTVEGDLVRAFSGAPTMTARMLHMLLDRVPGSPTLTSVHWASPTLGEEWSWSAEREPLAFLDTPRVRLRLESSP